MGTATACTAFMKAFRIPDPDIMQVSEFNYIAGAQTGNSLNWYDTCSTNANRCYHGSGNQQRWSWVECGVQPG